MNEDSGLSCFIDAKRLATKEYSKDISNGQVGYLPSLEGLLKDTQIVSEVNLGIVEIPLKKIKGTYSHLRSLTFAKNFMPLLETGTEFQLKWSAICEAHLNEGIRDPIKVYEYMNWFYVVEGNKRVSVLKYFNAYSVPANVTRLLPIKNEKDINNRIYYEFLKFNHITGIYSIWFSKKHSFSRLLRLLEKYENPDIPEFESKYKYFEVYIYKPFREIYLNSGGDLLNITTGDAFLEYVKIYGIPQKIDEKELKVSIKEFLKELKSISAKQSVNVLTKPYENTQNKVFSVFKTLVTPKRKLKVAFAYARTPEISGWTYSHELGRIQLEKKLGDYLTTSFVENIPENDDAYYAIKKLAEDGNDIVFTTSPIYMNSTLKCALEFPEVRFLNCSAHHPYTHVTNYYGRTYEPRFLTGLIAGAMTKTNIVGYVATYPDAEVISSINAFALGVRMVNPNASVKVSWTNEWNSRIKFTDAGTKLIHAGADVLCNRTLDVSHPVSTEYGVYSMLCTIDINKGQPDKYIATPIWQWGVFYEKILRNILNGTYKTIVDMFSSNSNLINFWWGIDAGVVDIFYSKEIVPVETQKLVNLMKKMIINSAYHPFTGPIYDQNGTLRIDVDETASHEQILNMDWYVDFVDVEPLEKKKESSH